MVGSHPSCGSVGVIPGEGDIDRQTAQLSGGPNTMLLIQSRPEQSR